MNALGVIRSSWIAHNENWQVESVSPWRQCAAIVLLIGRLEGMALFGINLPGGLGHVGGAQDEF